MNTKAHWKFVDGLRSRLNEFRSASAANVTVTFALATVPMIGFVGAAVDYSHANSVKAAMQAAADSTALMLSKIAGTTSAAELQAKGTAYFKALFNRPEASGLNVVIAYSTANGSEVKVGATADVKTDFMQMMGFQKLKIGADSTAKWGNNRLRVALALDVSLSMQSSNKMSTLKTSAKGFLKQLQNAATKNEDVYVSIIPFDKYVNVGKTNANQSWIRWDLWEEANTTYRCEDKKGNEIKDKGKTITSKSTCESKSIGGKWTTKLPSNSMKNAWQGCVTDRDQKNGSTWVNYDTTNTAPITSGSSAAAVATRFPVPAEDVSVCPEQLLPLTYKWSDLNAKIEALQPTGYTNQIIGMQWAFQTLTAAPFTIPPKDKDYEYQDVIILMTDGLNTANRENGMKTPHNSPMDARTTMVCDNAKAAGITIYTIQVNTSGDPTQEFLRTCASSPDKFFLLTSATQMTATFQQIGTALSNLRIAQ